MWQNRFEISIILFQQSERKYHIISLLLFLANKNQLPKIDLDEKNLYLKKIKRNFCTTLQVYINRQAVLATEYWSSQIRVDLKVEYEMAFLHFWRTRVLFMGPLIPLFWTFGDVSSVFQGQSGQPYLHLAEVYMMYVPWDSPLVQHLSTSWQPAWQPITFAYMHILAEVGCQIQLGDLLQTVQPANHSTTSDRFWNTRCHHLDKLRPNQKVWIILDPLKYLSVQLRCWCQCVNDWFTACAPHLTNPVLVSRTRPM